MFRKRLFEVMTTVRENDRLSNFYDVFMLFLISLSLVPLLFKKEPMFLFIMDKVVASFFILDYIMRLITADYKLKKGKASFFIYPVTPMAIIDLLSILPSLTLVQNSFRVLKMFRLLRFLQLLRVFRAIRYSRNLRMIYGVFRRQRKPLLIVVFLAAAYIMFSAMVMYNVEPEMFKDYFEAVYWATISLTTVGYGDITPVTVIGRAVTILSAVFGVAIIALPSGILAAGFIKEFGKKKQEEE